VTRREVPDRIGVIGDVHAEDDRLAAALGYLTELGVGMILCSGDLPDGVGSVTRCSELLREHRVVTVLGNHERWLLRGSIRDLPHATRLEDLSSEAREHLARLQPTEEFSTPLGGLLLCHGLGLNDMAKVGPDDFGYAIDVNDELQALMRDPRYQLVVNGHSHRAMVRHFPGLTVINAGTLRGDHDPGFLIVDFQAEEVAMHRFTGPKTEVYRSARLRDEKG
jgi:predicted phosphodiesterase